MKRERRASASLAASLTMCDQTWLERAPDRDELQRIEQAQRAVVRFGGFAALFGDDWEKAHAFSLELFRDPVFAPLALEDWVIAELVETLGDPPVPESDEDTTFTSYLQDAVEHLEYMRARKPLADQLRRFLPQYVDAGQMQAAVAIDYNAYRTSNTLEATPFLVQLVVAGLARWYDRDEQPEDD